MPKALVLGNGHILVGLDNRGQVQDFYYPYVGLENQISGSHLHKHRVGVWVEGEFRWLDHESWQININYAKETMSSVISAINDELMVRLDFVDSVYNEKNIFLREVTLTNLAKSKRTIKLFFGQEFQISESHRGDTAFYDPRNNTVVHYKGRRAFLINLRSGRQPFDGYSMGLFEIEGKQGTFRDAEDGRLEKNTNDHGSVDSVVSAECDLGPAKKKKFYYWIAAGKSLAETAELNEYVFKKTPAHLIKSSQDFWHAWVNRQNFSFYGLSKGIISLFKKSLFVVRSHVDNNGAIIASGDSDMLKAGRDNYSYVWPRDGALTALALERAGEFNVARDFFEFCNDVITEDGYFMHKYRADKSLGSSWHPWLRNDKVELPIQEDETALVLYALWEYYNLSRDLEFIEEVYNSLIKRAADFLVDYTYKDTGLPYPSYDLWEEKYGVSTFTCAAKYGGLIAASRFAETLGKTQAAKKYREAANKMREAMLKHLYNPERKMFRKLAQVKGKSMQFDDTLDMSSIYGVVKFGVLPPDDSRVIDSIKTIEQQLMLKGEINGVPRYERDYYYRLHDTAPPNPWFITTLWLAQYYIMIAESESDLEIAKEYLDWAVRHATDAGILSEQLNVFNGEQLSAAPLTWSHAEFIVTVIDYLEKLEGLGVCKACNPVGKRI